MQNSRGSVLECVQNTWATVCRAQPGRQLGGLLCLHAPLQRPLAAFLLPWGSLPMRLGSRFWPLFLLGIKIEGIGDWGTSGACGKALLWVHGRSLDSNAHSANVCCKYLLASPATPYPTQLHCVSLGEVCCVHVCTCVPGTCVHIHVDMCMHMFVVGIYAHVWVYSMLVYKYMCVCTHSCVWMCTQACMSLKVHGCMCA